jgi:hypothetical protein
LVEQVAHKGERSRVGRTQREGAGARPDIKDPVAVGFSKVGVFGHAQPMREVSEAVLVGGENDAAVLAVGIEAQHLVGRQGAPALPGGLVTLVGEGVFCVELEVVALEIAEGVDDAEEFLHRGDAAARDIEHDAARGEHGSVLDLAGGERLWARAWRTAAGVAAWMEMAEEVMRRE